ncbi:MAG TPA: DUF4190 domain-containing protein [Blastococcus sp.]|jgi:hypothetical protein|nr:DUF4190 domain-containing protein [Blastococcus sp.]
MSQDITTPQQSNAPATGRGGNGLAIAGLVCGLVGLLFFNVILGPLAIIFGGVGLSRATRGAGHRGMSIAAVVLGVVDLIIFVVLLAVAANQGGSMFFHVG